MTKGIKIFLIVLLSILVVGLLGVMIYFIFNKSALNIDFGFSSKISNNLVLEENYQPNKNINIDAEVAKIDVNISNSKEIKILIYSDDNIKSEITDNDTRIDIISKKTKNNSWRFNEKIAKIEIYVPSDYSNDINIKTNVGDINVDRLNTRIDIKSNVGDINIKEADYLDIELNLGDLYIDKVNEYLDLNVDCGDIKIQDIKLIRDSNIELDTGDIKIENISNIYIDAKNDIGNVKINNNYRESDITLTIENDTGDIKINN